MDLIEWLTMQEAPGATVAIMLICFAISFLNSSINRLLIHRFVGWPQYKEMQKEIAEYRTQMIQAQRKQDKKLLEKLKKKETQILNMQKKMFKPQMVLFVISLSYIFIWWFVLGPLYGTNIVAYIPGIGQQFLWIWYLICSLLFGTLASRVLGIMPIE
ncbi:MAG: EMC3/TMCO1 family protein [Candidatus Bathyarchaeota archaeon]|nr:EMC3/TMCO1 family protein [Candidatus Bathyarchaeota archaeon]MDI6805664.1 EMC3/TMCO1 family protein [Candidatus Bathyarchaeia archaeon]